MILGELIKISQKITVSCFLSMFVFEYFKTEKSILELNLDILVLSSLGFRVIFDSAIACAVLLQFYGSMIVF